LKEYPSCDGSSGSSAGHLPGTVRRAPRRPLCGRPPGPAAVFWTVEKAVEKSPLRQTIEPRAKSLHGPRDARLDARLDGKSTLGRSLGRSLERSLGRSLGRSLESWTGPRGSPGRSFGQSVGRFFENALGRFPGTIPSLSGPPGVALRSPGSVAEVLPKEAPLRPRGPPEEHPGSKRQPRGEAHKGLGAAFYAKEALQCSEFRVL